MSFEVTTNELSGKIMPFDHQVKKSDDPLPQSAGVIWIMSGKKGSGKSNLILNVLKRKGSPYKKFYDNNLLLKKNNVVWIIVWIILKNVMKMK